MRPEAESDFVKKRSAFVRRSWRVAFAELFFVFTNPFKNAHEAGAQISPGLPAQLPRCLPIVRPIKNDVSLPWVVGLSDRRGAGAKFLHEFGGFAKGDGIGHAASEVKDLSSEIGELGE